MSDKVGEKQYISISKYKAEYGSKFYDNLSKELIICLMLYGKVLFVV